MNDMLYYLPIGLTIISNVLYHIFLKMTPGNINPIFSLAFTYATALLGTLVIYFFYPSNMNFLDNFNCLNWASFALGLAIVGLETGFLLAYRMGWQVSLAGLVSNILVAVVLIPVGIVFFKESLNVMNVIGMFFCVIGILLVNYQM